MPILESKFQLYLIEKIKTIYPEAIVIKNDSEYIQGFPDLLVLIGSKWFALEVKANEESNIQPNQKYWINLLNKMSYAKIIFPENEEGIFYELQQTF